VEKDIGDRRIAPEKPRKSHARNLKVGILLKLSFTFPFPLFYSVFSLNLMRMGVYRADRADPQAADAEALVGLRLESYTVPEFYLHVCSTLEVSHAEESIHSRIARHPRPFSLHNCFQRRVRTQYQNYSETGSQRAGDI